MTFDQKEDGSCDIIFSEEEIKIMIEHKKLHLSQKFLKHFSNTLVKISIEFNERFNDKTKVMYTKEDGEIKGTTPKK